MLTQTPTLRADGRSRVVGYHKWRNLLFLHWPAPVEDVQPLLPERLNVDSFNGLAWIGLVAFDMHGIRPWWFPSIPGVSAFHETNVRTYVTLEGQQPGVWFFSLDAASSLAVRVARWRWHLNYFHSTMRLRRNGNTVAYSGTRRRSGRWDARYAIDATIAGSSVERPAVPDTFAHFLIERYVLYTRRRDGSLFRGSVRHVPYPLRPATITQCDESLIAAAGISVHGPPQHAVFSPGVDVEIHGLEPV